MKESTRPILSEDAAPGSYDVDAHEAAHHIVRIRRIGKRLFDVANCCVVFDDTFVNFPGNGKARRSVETSFCRALPLPEELTVVSDARADNMLRIHPMVTAAPHVRFYAACPIRDAENALIGSIALIDYRVRSLDEEEQHLLEDLARLVEGEMRLRSLSRTQLDLQRKNKNLRRKSLIDPLIGTWNRGAIMRILMIEATRCDKASVPLSLIVVDLDFFKKINDTYGHPAGDSVLVKIASRLRSCIRPQEALGRYGGEEFLIILPGSSSETAMAVGERMRLAIASQPELVNDKPLRLTISAGVASTDLFPAATTDELISFADMALYAAKDAGRNRVMRATVLSN